VDPNSERELLRFRQPFSNHNGGDLHFGPDDGLLYISTGDGGSGGDPQNNAQDLFSLLGKILRLDVAGSNGPGGQYGIPASNPFVDQPAVRDEIYAYGLRNPYRFSFDDGAAGAATVDRLFAGDVGQAAFEEVDLILAGGNYGWRIREGAHPFNSNDPDPGNLGPSRK
jgi:glucose/arabinose dehydrogenase